MILSIDVYIQLPDETGFRGMTSFAPIVMNPAKMFYFDSAGYKGSRPTSDKWVPVNSDVVCVESGPATDNGLLLHSAVHLQDSFCVLPPLCLLEVVRVDPAPFEFFPAVKTFTVKFEIVGTSGKDVGESEVDPLLIPRGAREMAAVGRQISFTIPSGVVVAGSCREDINGTYMFTGFHSGRPCYEMKGKVLHYKTDSAQWYFGTDVTSTSYYSLCKDPQAAVPSDVAVTWTTFNGVGTVTDTHLTCTPEGNTEWLGTVQAENMISEAKMINQRLITVRPTYMLPMNQRANAGDASPKFAGEKNFLHFGSLQDGVRGLDDITDEPVLTMEQVMMEPMNLNASSPFNYSFQEWARDDQWTDWLGSTVKDTSNAKKCTMF